MIEKIIAIFLIFLIFLAVVGIYGLVTNPCEVKTKNIDGCEFIEVNSFRSGYHYTHLATCTNITRHTHER